MKDYRLKVTIRNNRILRAIDAAGFDSIADFCRKFGLNYQVVNSLIRMQPAKGKRGEWSACARGIADALQLNPDDLFNARQAQGFQTTSTEREVDEHELPMLQSWEGDDMRALPAPEQSPEASAEQKELVRLALQAMTPRQRDMISKRYGLGGIGEHTLDEVAEDYPGNGQQQGTLSRERIRGIECQALRKARSALLFDHKVDGLYLDNPHLRQRDRLGMRRNEPAMKLVVPKEEAEEEGFSWDD